MKLLKYIKNKLGNLFDKPYHAELDLSEDNMVRLYDKYGRELLVPRSQWYMHVLATDIQTHWNDPDRLYATILTAFNDKFYVEIAKASKRLLKIDKNKERSTLMLSTVLVKLGKRRKAEGLLNYYIWENNATADILARLSEIYIKRGKFERALETLEQALELDPNQVYALDKVLVVEEKAYGNEAYLNKLKKIAKRNVAWRAKLCLANEYLKVKDLKSATVLYNELFQQYKDIDNNEILLSISSSLGHNGYFSEAITLIYPRYHPEKNDIGIGFNLLEACLQIKNTRIGEKLLHRLYLLNLPQYKKELLYYSDEFEKLIKPTFEDLKNTDVAFNLLILDRPIWSYNLEEPTWMYQLPFTRLQNIVFIPFTIEQEKNPDKKNKNINIIGGFSRGIPLYLSECLFMYTHIGFKYLQTLANGYPVADTEPHYIEELMQYAQEGERYVVTGKVKYTDKTLAITLQFWDCVEKKCINEQKWLASEKTITKILREIERYFFYQIFKLYGVKTQDNFDFYSQIKEEHLYHYVTALEQLLALTIINIEDTSNYKINGERHILENFYYLAVELDYADVGKILMLSGLSAMKFYGTQVYLEFKQSMLMLLSKKLDPNVIFDLLSIYFFKLYALNNEFQAHLEQLANVKNPAYHRWLKEISDY